jgi:phosphoribosylanthranilate isomerase
MRVKICGLRSRGDLAAAAAAGAAYAGFVFYPRSPRNLTLADARWIAGALPEGIVKVALTVDADDAALEAILDALPIDVLQLHGRETPARVEEVRSRFGLPVFKAVGLAGEGDLAALDLYGEVADQLLVDARAPAGAPAPGGNGIAFDWRLLRNRRWPRPWLLAGGLTAENVSEAVRLTGASQVDVSSGVERAPGRKDHGRIAEFVQAARSVA